MTRKGIPTFRNFQVSSPYPPAHPATHRAVPTIMFKWFFCLLSVWADEIEALGMTLSVNVLHLPSCLLLFVSLPKVENSIFLPTPSLKTEKESHFKNPKILQKFKHFKSLELAKNYNKISLSIHKNNYKWLLFMHLHFLK